MGLWVVVSSEAMWPWGLVGLGHHGIPYPRMNYPLPSRVRARAGGIESTLPPTGGRARLAADTSSLPHTGEHHALSSCRISGRCRAASVAPGPGLLTIPDSKPESPKVDITIRPDA